MIRKSFLAVVSAAALLFAAPFAAAQTVDEIIAKNLQAKGGVEKLKSIQSMKKVAQVKTQGVSVALTMYGKRPNLMRKELAVGPQLVLYVFDGRAGWARNPLSGSSDPKAVTGSELDALRQESEFDIPFVDYKTRGYTIELIGTETSGDRKVHHLKLAGPGRPTQECYIDDQTGLETRVVNQTPLGSVEQVFGDFRDVQGLKLPFSIRTVQNGVVLAEMTVQTIEMNAAIDDNLFRMPGR